jgi:hypothetical protein
MLRRLYDWTMAKAAHRHAEWWLAAFAFVEASFFPIPPHPLLGLMCLAEPNKAIRRATPFAGVRRAAMQPRGGDSHTDRLSADHTMRCSASLTSERRGKQGNHLSSR